MHKKLNFKKSLLASSIAMLSSSVAIANDQTMQPASTEKPEIEEVLVTGIQASLQRAMDLKREAQGIVDAISAEDIGKFPDTNLAESLQRITGVSIDRRDGEGSKVTVRGLGPDFNLVTFNGRQMPGATLASTYASGSRSFDFGNLASEGISAVKVYKTARANLPTGGMGATINIETAKPLSTPGTQAAIGFKSVYDKSSDKSQHTPEISGIYSQTFADDTFGIAITGSVQERKGGNRNATVGTGWRSFSGAVTQDWSTDGANEWGGAEFHNRPDFFVNQPATDDVYSTPQSVGYGFSEFERSRINGHLTMQYAPSDSFVATLDYTYNERDVEVDSHSVGAWFNFGGQSALFTDNPSPAVQTPLIYSEDMSNGDLTFSTGRENQHYENNSIGLNLKWEPTENLRFTADFHHSTAEALPDNEFGNSVGITASAYVRDRTTLAVMGDVPTMIIDINNGQQQRMYEIAREAYLLGNPDATDEEGPQLADYPIDDALLVDDLQVSGSYFRSARMKHEIDQFQIEGEWEFSDWASLSFGAARTEGDLYSVFGNNQRDSWSGLGEAGDLPEEFFTLEAIKGFSGTQGVPTAEQMASIGAAGANTTPLAYTWRYNFNDLANFAAANYDDGEGQGNCSNGSTYYCAPAELNNANQIIENSNSAFVQLNVDTEVRNMPFKLFAGVRYESTEVETPASDYTNAYGPVTWISVNELSMAEVADPKEVTDSGEYDYFLPMVDFSIEPIENFFVRASYGQSIARADWGNLRGGTSYSRNPRVEGGIASRGTPGLKPFKSENIDLSVEWYYGESSYLSAGYFKKEVENFIGSRVIEDQEPLQGVPHPANGPRYQAALESGIAPNDPEGIRQYIFDNFPDPDYAYLNNEGVIEIVGIPGEDGNTTFDITEVANSEDIVDYEGLELAVQHGFGDTGFGVIVNYTFVDESTKFDTLLLGESQFAVTGASDSANFIGYYEKYGLQARIAYNWRDSFLASQTSGTGNNPIFVDEYSQIDFNLSYELTEQATVFFEGLNITEEAGRNYGRAYNQVLGFYENGARFNVGGRYSF